MIRETIYSALFAQSASILGFNTKRRRVRHWSDLSNSEFPALFQGQGREAYHQQRGLPTKFQLSPKQYLYVRAGNDGTVDPSTIINPMLDKLDEKFGPTGEPNVQTLGGLASHCWISDVELMEGVLGAVEVAIITFDILTL